MGDAIRKRLGLERLDEQERPSVRYPKLSRQQRRLFDQEFAPRFRPLQSVGQWEIWFDQQQASLSKNVTELELQSLRNEFRDRTRTPEAGLALKEFSANPTTNAVEIAVRLVDHEAMLLNTSRLYHWSFPQTTLKELLPLIKSGLVTLRARGTDVQRQIDDGAALQEVAGNTSLAETGKRLAAFVTESTQDLSYLLLARHLHIVLEDTQRLLDVSPGDVMTWLVAKTPEGKELVRTVASCGSFNRQSGGSTSLEPLWDYLDPGVADVLRTALDQSTPNKGNEPLL